MSWYSDGEHFDEYDPPYCERCRRTDVSYEVCKRCVRMHNEEHEKDEEEEEDGGKMAKYIDVEPIIATLRIMAKEHKEQAHGNPFEAVHAGTIAGIANAIDKLPAADVQEVRHGRWVLITKDGIVPAEFLCSVCGRKISHSGVKDMVSIHYPYCHCGAKMDEVSKDE